MVNVLSKPKTVDPLDARSRNNPSASSPEESVNLILI